MPWSAKAREDAITNDRHLPWLVLTVHNIPLRVKLVEDIVDIDCLKDSSLVDSWVYVVKTATAIGTSCS